MIFGDFQSHCIWAPSDAWRIQPSKADPSEAIFVDVSFGISKCIWLNYSDRKHDQKSQRVAFGREIPLFLGNLDAWYILIWPDFMSLEIWAVFQGPWLAVVYRGLYYWLIWGLYIIRVLNVAHLKTFLQNLVGLVRKNEQPHTTHSNDPPCCFRMVFHRHKKHSPKV